MAICKCCGKEFDLETVADEFSELCYYADYFDLHPPGEYCAECAFEAVEYAENNDDGMEPCCVACGNGAYPDCKASCSIFDD